MIDLADDGSHKASNLVIACFKCNQRRNGQNQTIRQIARFHLVAPNRLFGCQIKDGCAI